MIRESNKTKIHKGVVILLKRKSLVMMVALLAIVAIAAVPAFASTGDQVADNVRIKAYYHLTATTDHDAVIEFSDNDYSRGYAQATNRLKLQVSGPGSFDVYATGSNNNQGVLDALYVNADQGWKDINSGNTPVYSQSNSGVYRFWVDYRAYANQLNPGQDDVDEIVTVTYGFI